LPVLPFKSIKNKRSFTYIENLVGFIDRIIELKASGIFIAKDDKDLSTTELVSLIAKSLNKKTILVKVPNFYHIHW
jgi:nucleoside-diphosphate-sugar epimerase